MKTLTALIPFYNEERTLPELVRQLSELPAGIITKIIFVNDGSADGSLALLENALSSTNLNCKIISKSNGGKASAIRQGSRHLETSHVVILDADLELKTSDVVKLWNAVLENDVEAAFGFRRFLSQSSFTYRYVKGNQFISLDFFIGVL